VTSTVIQRSGEGAREAERLQQAEDTKKIVDAMVETRAAIAALDERLDRIESQTSR
jgi:2-keto-3-deoxy-L-rhamnonate aldolase RhmA